MTTTKKVSGTASSVPGGLAWGILTSAVSTLMGAVITAKLIDSEVLIWEKTGYAVLVILLVSAWLGAMVAAAKIKRRRIAVCMATGTAYMMVLLCVTALFFGGQYSGVGETALLIFCGSMVAVFTGYPGKAARKPIKTKRPTVKLNKIT